VSGAIEPLEQCLLDALAWVCGNDSGESSRAMLLSAITGKPPEPCSYPRDASDEGRCVRMLMALPWAYPRSLVGWTPEWSKAWSRIVKRWENGEVKP